MMQKFRVFDKKYKKIMKVNEINFEKSSVWIESDSGDHENRHTLTRGFDEVIIMQSTGLTDKNGVEIFEGDVVEHLDFNSNEISKSEVRILKGCFYLVISVDGFKYDVPMMDLIDNECILEIKGNIYENPELLEDV